MPELKHKHRRRGPLILAALFLLAGCGPKTQSADSGRFEDGVYRNRYFHISLPVPEGWNVETPPPGLGHFLRYYLKIMAVHEKADNEKDRVVPMMRMMSGPSRDLGPLDGVIMAGAARVSDKPGFDLSRAVDFARLLIKESPTPVRLMKDFESTKLGELTFVHFQAEWTMDRGRIMTAYYITLRGDYVLVFSVLAKASPGLERGMKVLEAISFSTDPEEKK